jgi:hypothetical protein
MAPRSPYVRHTGTLYLTDRRMAFLYWSPQSSQSAAQSQCAVPTECNHNARLASVPYAKVNVQSTGYEERRNVHLSPLTVLQVRRCRCTGQHSIRLCTAAVRYTER